MLTLPERCNPDSANHFHFPPEITMPFPLPKNLPAPALMRLSISIPILLLTAVFLAMTSALTAQDLPPPQDAPSLLQELERIEKGASSLTERRRSEAISRIQSAAASPSAALELHLAATDAVKYSDRHQEFLDWKQKNQETLRNSSFQNAAQLQLRYLLIGLQRNDRHDAVDQVPETLSYLNTLVEFHFLEKPPRIIPTKKGILPPPPPPHMVVPDAAELLRQQLPESPVVQWLRIDDLLPEKNFQKSPANFAGIMDQNVKSPLRERRDPRLPGVWDLQITAETAATVNDDTQSVEIFRKERIPELIFGKIKDRVTVGQPNHAVAELMNLIRTYPSHTSMPDWIKTAKGLLSNPPSPSPTPTPAATKG
jgi:hypothetical protein